MSERQPKPNSLNNAYLGIVDNLVGGATSDEKKLWQRGGIELSLSGFHGELGKQIADWNTEGLGRLFGVPQPENPSHMEDRLGAYHGLMYALPLREENAPANKQMVLLLIPNGKEYDMVFGRPRSTRKGEDIFKQANDERFLQKYKTLYSPSLEPFIYNGQWTPPENERPYHTLVNRQESFFIELNSPIAKGVENEAIKTAIKVARQMKKRRDAAEILWEKPEAA